MTAPFTAEQENRLAAIEAAEPAPESCVEVVARAIADSDGSVWEFLTDDWLADYRRNARAAIAALQGPDSAAAAVQRVEEWAAMHDDMARQYDEAALSVETLALVDEAQQHAEDCRAIAEGVRNALRGESR